MKRPLPIEVSDLATAQIRAAEEWWRANRPAAPHAIREELERASWLIAVQPGVGAVARNVSLAGVRRLHLARIRYHLYYQVITDPDRVEVLAFWQRRETRDVVRVQPALVGHTDVLINTADAMGGQGMQRLAVTRGADGWTVDERWTSRGLKPYFNDFVVHEGHAYGFDGSILSAIDVETGERRWKGGRYGHGQMILLAEQDLLLVLSEHGEIALVNAKPDGFAEVARMPALDEKSWNHPVLAGDLLLVRNGVEMVAFRLPLVR